MLVFNHSKSRCKKLPIILECQNLLIVSKLTYFTVCSQPNNFPGLIIGFEPRPSSAPPRHVFVKISIWVCAQVWERKKMLLTISSSQPACAGLPGRAGHDRPALNHTTPHPVQFLKAGPARQGGRKPGAPVVREEGSGWETCWQEDVLGIQISLACVLEKNSCVASWLPWLWIFLPSMWES